MLLTELTLNTADSDIQAIVDTLSLKRNLNVFSGYNAVVLEFPNKNYVYRVWSADAGYEKFLSKISGIKSEHVVRILSRVRKHQLADGTPISFVKLEKLVEPSRANMKFADAVSISTESLGPGEIEEMGADGVAETISYVLTDDLNVPEAKAQEMIERYEELIALVVELGSSGDFDLHSGNFMERDGVLVITDPYHIEGENGVIRLAAKLRSS